MTSVTAACCDTRRDEDGEDLRAGCHGAVPLPGRVASWMWRLLQDDRLHQWVADYGSPLNVVNPHPFLANAQALTRTASQRDVSFRPFFARKANKCLAFVDAAIEAQLGIDCASAEEIRQSLNRGANPCDIICTAAVKDRQLLELCRAHGATIAVDNFHELSTIDALPRGDGGPARLALRMSGFLHQGEKLRSRFGLDVDQIPDLLHLLADCPAIDRQIVGLHFHLDGYSAAQRVSAIRQLLPLVDALRKLGEPVSFLDIGGGLPVCYLQSEADWSRFWREHQRALIGQRQEITYRNDPLGRWVHGNDVLGAPKAYPFFQQPARDEWLGEVLDAEIDGESVALSLAKRQLELRCEPGRSLLDDAGLSIARVEGVKQLSGGDGAVLLAMNGTQCRTSSADFFVDPVLVRAPQADEHAALSSGESGYLFGAYCTESDLIVKRRLVFPQGIGVGDLVVLPNTAGYFMHFLESRSHQFPLAKNLVDDATSPKRIRLDDIDAS